MAGELANSCKFKGSVSMLYGEIIIQKLITLFLKAWV